MTYNNKLIYKKINQYKSQKFIASQKMAKSASQINSDFLANMSHEIRIKMHGVIGMSELLLKTKLSDQQNLFANGIMTSAISLIDIINEFIDFTKVESGKNGTIAANDIRESADKENFRLMRVLVAEDNVTNQAVVANMLQIIGCSVDVVSSGREAVEFVGQHHYDIIFMDSNMPDLNGFEATKRIRRLNNTNKHTAIVALTANAIIGDREKCLAAGMDDYLSKPVSFSTLQEVVTHWRTPQLRLTTKPSDFLDEVKGIKTVSEDVFDTVRLQKLIQMFNKTGKDFVPAVVDPYLKSVEKNIPALYSAIEKSNYSEVSSITHYLLGGSRNLGLQKFSEICASIQDNAARHSQYNARELVFAMECELQLIKVYLEDMKVSGSIS